MREISYKIYVKGKLHGKYTTTEARQAALKSVMQDKTLRPVDIKCEMMIEV